MPSHPSIRRAGCKINLYLRVGDTLPNGYHELDTLFVPLPEPHDVLYISKSPACEIGETDDAEQKQSGIQVEFSVPGIDPARNTLTKAYAWYAALTGFTPHLHVRVEKNVPHGAGLGGGSADAAVLILYLQEEAAKAGHTLLSQRELLEKSAAVGADVPFFLLGTAATATGVGEKLVPVPNPCVGCYLVLVCPDIAVSTAWAFAALDTLRGIRNNNCATEGTEKNASPSSPADLLRFSGNKEQKIEKNSAYGLTSAARQATYDFAYGGWPGNDFEDLVFTHWPLLARLYARLCSTGAELTRMSGTGSSMFALFRDESKAKETAKALASDGHKVYMQML